MKRRNTKPYYLEISMKTPVDDAEYIYMEMLTMSRKANEQR